MIQDILINIFHIQVHRKSLLKLQFESQVLYCGIILM